MFEGHTLMRVGRAPVETGFAIYTVVIRFPDGRIVSGHMYPEDVDQFLNDMPHAPDLSLPPSLDYVSVLPGNALTHEIRFRCCKCVYENDAAWAKACL